MSPVSEPKPACLSLDPGSGLYRGERDGGQERLGETCVITTNAVNASVAARRRASPATAAIGSSHTTYHGRSHALVSSSSSVAHPVA